MSSAPTGGAADVPSITLTRPRISFEKLYEQHYRFVWRVLRAFGVPPPAIDDATQDVFVVVHRRLPSFEGRSDVRTWLFAIARWVASNERRRLHAIGEQEPVDESIGDSARGPFEIAMRSEAVQTIERIFAEMDDEKRVVFVLMEIEEMKGSEVAELLEINVNTVHSRLRLAREQFRVLLARHSEVRKRGER